MSIDPSDEELKKQKEDSARHKQEAELLYKYYNYDGKSVNQHEHIITIGRYKSEEDKKTFEKSKLYLENQLIKKNKQIEERKLSEKRHRQKKIEIAELEIRISYYKNKIQDTQTHYELFDKINTKATLNPTPKTLNLLKNQTTRVNNAIQRQRRLLTTLKKHRLSLAKAERSLSTEHLELAKNLLTKSPQKAIEDSIGSGSKQAIKEKNAVLAYIQCERNKRDAKIDHQFSRKIFENAVRDASKEADVTKELKEQFASLATAINEREAHKKDLVTAEAKKLENFNTLIFLKKEIAKVTKNTIKFNDKEDRNEKLAALEQRLEALYLEDKQLNRQIDDANRLYIFSNQLIAEALKEGDAKKLAKKLQDLKVAANRQKIYRKKLEAVESKILKTNTKKPKTENNKERNELTKIQLNREKDDATLAHSMMTELIDNAIEQKIDLTTLKTQSEQLKAGIGGTFFKKPFGQVKNRLRLEKAENKHLEIEIKRKENKQRLDIPKFDNTKRDLNLLRDAERHEQEAVQRGESKGLESSVILNRMSLHQIRELGKLTITDATLSLEEQQALRRVENATQDHNIGRQFLEQARRDKNPANLQAQFALMVTTVADRNILRRQLEEEETRQIKKKNEIKKTVFEVVEHKKKLEIAKEELKSIERTGNTSSPEFRARQLAVYESAQKLQYKEWELKKLERRQAENATFDERRLKDAQKNALEANRLLTIILNPDPKAESKIRDQAIKDLKELKKRIEKEKKLERKLAPPDRVKERAQYRADLEKAEEKRLEHTKKMNALAIEEFKASLLVHPLTEKQNRLAAQRKRLRDKLETEDEQIKREEAEAKLLYEFSAKLIQLSIDNTSEDNVREAAKKLKAQFKELRRAANIQKNLRTRIETIDKKMNSRLYLSLNKKTKNQLQRQKNNLIFGHAETQKLIEAASKKNPLDLKALQGLRNDCKNLSTAIGGYSVLKGGFFGQEKNREALDKCETRYLENQKKLDNATNASPEHENYTLLKKQSKRRLAAAKRDYIMGDALLKAAVADEPKNPSKAERLANLVKQFAALDIAIQERNKVIKILEKIEEIEENAEKTKRKDEKNINNAEAEKASLVEKLETEKAALKTLEKAPPPLSQKTMDAINKQAEKVKKLEEQIANKTNKIEHLTKIKDKNEKNNTQRIAAAKASYDKTTAAVENIAAKSSNEFASIYQELRTAELTENSREVRVTGVVAAPAAKPTPVPASTPTAKAPPPRLPLRPSLPNSLSVSVHTSDIAMRQAASVVAIQTKGQYIMEPKLNNEGKRIGYILFENNPKTKIAADIIFESKNAQEQKMTAQFTGTISDGAIEAIAIFSAVCQPNDKIICTKTPPNMIVNFNDKALSERAETTFNKEFDKKYELERTKQSLTSIANDNGTVARTAQNALENKENKEQQPGETKPQKPSITHR